MGVYYGAKTPPVVASGLILNLDAAKSSSYPGSGSTWYDISGSGYTGTISGATYAAGPPASFSFNGSTNFVSTNASSTLSAATFLCWIKNAASQGQWAGLMFNRSTSIFGLGFNTGNGLSYTWNNDANTYGFNSGLSPTTGVWCQVAVSISASSATFYQNTTAGNTNTYSHVSQTLNSLNIGNDSLGGRLYNGNVGVALLYNRALSAAEITQNYNAFRSRFGL